MILPVTHQSQYARTLTKIKYDFDYTFRYDMFILKGSQAPTLPDGLNCIFKMQGLRYVDFAVQYSGLNDGDEDKLLSEGSVG